MAELDALSPIPDHQKLDPQKISPQKPVTSLLYRAAIFLLVAAVLFFPSQAPEFVSETLLTRSWELLHLLFVGITISYGLFSHRNVEVSSVKEAVQSCADGTNTKPQSYLTQLLQMSPVFEDEGPGTPSAAAERRIEMWTSRYHRGEPTVVVTPSGEITSDGRRLLLPVRSLRLPASQAEYEPVRKEEHEKHSIAIGEDITSSIVWVENRKVSEVDTVVPTEEEELAGEAAVDMTSTLPWRSRSARIELNEVSETFDFRSLSFHSLSSRPSSSTSSPRRLSPSFSASTSPSPNPKVEANEDGWRSKVLLYGSPPQSRPHPPFVHKTPCPPHMTKISCGSFKYDLTTYRFGSQEGDDDREWSSPRGGYNSIGKSVRTVRPKKVMKEVMADVVTRLTMTREKEKDVNKRMTTMEAEDEYVNASNGRKSDEDDKHLSNAGDMPGATATAWCGAAAAAEQQEATENEVDRKADEFIAKFREQIRLQRIDFVKKTVAAPGIPRQR